MFRCSGVPFFFPHISSSYSYYKLRNKNFNPLIRLFIFFLSITILRFVCVCVCLCVCVCVLLEASFLYIIDLRFFIIIFFFFLCVYYFFIYTFSEDIYVVSHSNPCTYLAHVSWCKATTLMDATSLQVLNTQVTSDATCKLHLRINSFFPRFFFFFFFFCVG